MQTTAHQAAQSTGLKPTSNAEDVNVAKAAPLKDRLSPSQADVLWARLTSIFGHRFTSSYGDNPNGMAGDTWSRTLADLTSQQLTAGLHACAAGKTRDGWPPTLPEFRAFCLNIPSLAHVRSELNSVGASPFTCLVWSYIDSYQYSRADEDRSHRLVRDAYDLAREHVLGGGSLPEQSAGEIQQEKEAIKPVPVSDSIKAKNLALAELLKGST